MSYILIVDSSEDHCELLRFILERAGFACATADSASSARAAIQDETPLAVITEYFLTDAPGEQFLNWLTKEYPQISVILASGVAHIHVRAAEAGVRQWLLKPYDPDQLLQVLAATVPEYAFTAAAN